MIMTEKDEKFINEKYNLFLLNIKQYIENEEIDDSLEIYKIISNMFRNGKFSVDGNVEFKTDFDYITFSNMKNIGTQVMCGMCCCRHASSFVFDILKTLGLDVSLYYINIENNDWISSNPNQANHITILLKDKNLEYLLDPINDFILKIESDNRLNSLDTKPLNDFDTDIFNDDVNEIGAVLKKYYCYKRLGINTVHDY